MKSRSTIDHCDYSDYIFSPNVRNTLGDENHTVLYSRYRHRVTLVPYKKVTGKKSIN